MTDIPQTSSAPITDPREGRDAVVAELRRRWLGPLGGEDETLDRNPVYAYLVGTLYPVEQGSIPTIVGDATEGETVDASALEDPAPTPDDEDPGAGIGEVAEEDVGINITGAFGWAPQSMGVSFVHNGDVVAVDVAAGVYEKVAVEDDGNPDGSKVDRWLRRPLADRHMVIVTGSGSAAVLDGRARLSWRSRIHGDHRLTTVSLSNAEEVSPGEAKKHPDLCLFQARMSCTDETGLRPYPQGDVYSSDEDQELAFRYRNKPAFAIGHGIAVDWEPSESPISVTTAVLPETDSPLSARRALRMTSTPCGGLRTTPSRRPLTRMRSVVSRQTTVGGSMYSGPSRSRSPGRSSRSRDG